MLLLSTVLLSLSLPGAIFKDGLGFLAFIALIPLFYVIRNTSFKAVWLYGFFYGFVFYRIFNFWLASFHPLANLITQIIKGAEMIGLFLALKAVDRWFDERLSFFFQALVFVAYYYLAQSWFAGYPYGTIAYALFKYKILIQISDLFGIWGLIIMLVVPQAFIGGYLCKRLSRTVCDYCESFRSYLLANRIAVILYIAAFTFQIVYGCISYANWTRAEEDTSFRVATVQHNADSWKGGFTTYERNFHNLSRMSLEALEENPDMIVWSETAFVPSVYWYTNYPYTGDAEGEDFDYLRKIQGLVDEFVDFASNIGVPLLTGNPRGELAPGATEPYTEDGDWNKIDYNSVILFDEGEIKDSYLKQHLVPFTEHFPYEKQLPLLYNFLLANDYNWWEEGKESKVFTTSNGITFSTPICFEDIFGELCADFIDNGADLLVNMTNDSWSGSVVSERQHAAMAVFRAVENRRTVLRGTNSGITSLITPDGTIQGEMEPFTMGWRIWDVPVFSNSSYGKTLYTRTGDVFARCCVYLSLAILCTGAVLSGIRNFRKKHV